MKYIVWHDNDYDFAHWICKNTLLDSYDVELRALPATNSKNSIMKSFSEESTRPVLPLIKYETPDIIIEEIDKEDFKVLCVLEFMTHTPQWQHPAQRYSRIYNSATLGVPCALVLPRKKMKEEKGKGNEYKSKSYMCSPSVYSLFLDTSRKFASPALLFHWPDKDGYLKFDEYHPTAPLREKDIEELFEFVNLCVVKKGKLEQKNYDHLLTSMESHTNGTPVTTSFETIKGVFDTSEVVRSYKLDKASLSTSFSQRDKTLVLSPDGLSCPSSNFRTDPYAGMLCAFDTLFCRDNNGYRNVNIIMIANNISLEEIDFSPEYHNESECPFVYTNKEFNDTHLSNCTFTKAKYRRIYGEVADVVCFNDSNWYRRTT